MTGLVPLAFKSPSLGVDPAAIPRIGTQILLSMAARNDYRLWFGGAGSFAGIVTIDGVPVRRRARLYESSTGVLLRELWSGSDGSYLIEHLSTEIDFTLTATDDFTRKEDIIATRVRAT